MKDIFLFLKERKKWWLMPIVFTLVILGVLFLIGGSGVIAPFIYSLF